MNMPIYTALIALLAYANAILSITKRNEVLRWCVAAYWNFVFIYWLVRTFRG